MSDTKKHKKSHIYVPNEWQKQTEDKIKKSEAQTYERAPGA